MNAMRTPDRRIQNLADSFLFLGIKLKYRRVRVKDRKSGTELMFARHTGCLGAFATSARLDNGI